MKEYLENPEGKANQKATRETNVAVAMAKAKKFCLSCGEVHYKEICPYCDSDAQEDL